MRLSIHQQNCPKCGVMVLLLHRTLLDGVAHTSRATALKKSKQAIPSELIATIECRQSMARRIRYRLNSRQCPVGLELEAVTLIASGVTSIPRAFSLLMGLDRPLHNTILADSPKLSGILLN